jgi:dihydrofolate reductase
MISIVVAMSRNRVIGVKNQLPWHLPKDLKHFKVLTTGKPVVMGSRTYESIPERLRPLPGRTNIVLTRDTKRHYDGAITVHTIEEALEAAKKDQAREICIIGGGQVFASALPRVDRIYLTIVDTEIENGETFFPELHEKDWTITSLGHFKQDEKHAFSGTFYQYDRRKRA